MTFSLILTEISISTLIKQNRKPFIIFSLMKPTVEVRPVLKDGTKYRLYDEHRAKIFKTTRIFCKETKLK